MKILVIAHLLIVCLALSEDPNTFSNYHDVQIKHINFEWVLDLDYKWINATAEYNFEFSSNGVQYIDLDIYQLDILYVYYPTDGKLIPFQIDSPGNQSLSQGDRLRVPLSRPYNAKEKLTFRVKYGLDQRARALSFLTASQTDSKTQPYLFSQCEAANCRSMAPLQDTPSIKQTYRATVYSKPGINVYMSGNLTTTQLSLGTMDALTLSQYTVTTFESTILVPSYLIAIIAGNVEQRQVGKRTFVITEPTNIDKDANELSDLETYLETLEAYIGDYLWGEYKIVILPASFPFGGMENPLLTFASPTIIVGDKSGAPIAIHEIAHSWTGNTATCNNWSNMWINEGFCVFLERKASRKLFGDDYYKIDSINGNAGMLADIQMFGIDSNYSSLHPETEDANPDDSWSRLPYEKGFQLLTYIESLYESEEQFQSFMRAFIANFRYKSLDEQDVLDFLTKWTKDNVKTADTILQKVNDVWQDWVYKGGLPPVKLDFSTQAVTQAREFAQAYIDLKGASSPPDVGQYQNYITDQKYIFLQYLIDHASELTDEIILRIDSDQMVCESTNAEILYRWFTAALSAKYLDDMEKIHRFLGSVGRLQMLKPIYQELNILNQQSHSIQIIFKSELAVQYLNEYKDTFYHPLTVEAIQNILNIPRSAIM